MARPLFDSEYIFGIHEPGGEGYMLDAGRPGWIVFTEAVGSEPNDRGGKDFRPWSDRGLGVICRINNGYHPAGTIPHSSRYADFAGRCANYVAASPGCKIWIIGNEMNFAIERPQGGPAFAPMPAGANGEAQAPSPQPKPRGGPLWRLWQSFLRGISGGMGDAELGQPPEPPPHEQDPFFRSSPQRFSALREQPAAAPLPTGAPAPAAMAAPGGQVITPDPYARCYTLCRDAIRAVPGHANDQVLVGAVAPWNNQTTYPGNPNGDWVQYYADILKLLGPQGCDGMALHTYTHQADPNLIRSEARMDPPFQNRRFEFRTYQDFMAATPQNMRHLPVYITETDQDVPWLDRNIGWVQQAYGEIDAWNRQPGAQQIRSLVLYRWPRIDKWHIEGKQGVVDDYRAALRFDYKWRPAMPPSAGFKVGQRIATTDTVNFRKSPGFIGKGADDVIGQLPNGAEATVLSALAPPRDGLLWWNVEAEVAGAKRKGYLAQFTSDGLPLLAPVAAKKPEGIAVGGAVRTLTVVRLRRTPGLTNKPANDVIMELATGVRADVVDGPRSADNLRWWNIRGSASGQTFDGWSAETAPGDIRLLEPVASAAAAPVEAPAEAAAAPPPARLAAGDGVRTPTTVRLRRTPGITGKPANDVLADMPPQTGARLLAGPRSADGLTWWQLHATLGGRTVTGWAAEVDPGGIRLLEKVAAAPVTPPSAGTFRIGQRVKTLTIVRLRKTPGASGKGESDVLADVPNGTELTVLEGPRSADGLTWWQVDYRSPAGALTGWMAERGPDGMALLAAAGAQPTPPPSGDIAPGDVLVVANAVRVRRTPGLTGKGDDDVLGEFPSRTSLFVLEGPRSADGLRWFRVGGVSADGLTPGRALVGWVAEKAPDGTLLAALPKRLAGTAIPDKAAGSYLHAPYRGRVRVTQLWGERPDVYRTISYDGAPLKGHNGIDFGTTSGTELLAVDDGIVAEAVHNDPTGFGHYVKLVHNWGESLYAHLESLAVQAGQQVARGAVLGRSDNTGFSDGPHLHFSIRVNPNSRTDGWGGFTDPMPYLNPKDYVLPSYVQGAVAAAAALPQAAAAPARTNLDERPGYAPDQPGVRRP